MSRTPIIRTLSTRKAATSELEKQDRRAADQKGYGVIGSLVSLFFGIILTIVALRFVFRLLGANETNGIVSWIYSASQPLVAPFFGIFGHDVNVMTGRFELDTLVALVVYGVIASIITGLFARTYGRPHSI